MIKIKCAVCSKKLNSKLFIKKNGIEFYVKCTDCRNKEKQKYKDLKNSKLCPKCKCAVDENTTCCKDCQYKFKIIVQERRDNARKNGLCIYCFKQKINDEKNLGCKLCLEKRDKRTTVDKLFTQAKARAKRTNRSFNIEKKDIILPECCPIFGVKLMTNKKHCEPNSYSLDRVDSSIGYIKGNIQVISHRANQIKNDATLDELKLLVNYLESLKN